MNLFNGDLRMLSKLLKTALIVAFFVLSFCNPASAGSMNILYMNQGGGEWGGIRYSNYDLILLAESNNIKQGFERIWSGGVPVMSIQGTAGKRLTSQVQDLDKLSQGVRPIPSFTTRGDNVRVVFVHLKSGNAAAATKSLNKAIETLTNEPTYNPNQPVIWVGDFNRADDTELLKLNGAKMLISDGGQAKWYLDRLYVSGNWTGIQHSSKIVSISSDNAHAGIEFLYAK
ncbi:MAG: hypothetical protein J7647_22890 [Cyanobacteria bacterium SBLK]|nr:hypothetical protein [Cyanobacteria bacterium SBLK]